MGMMVDQIKRGHVIILLPFRFTTDNWPMFGYLVPMFVWLIFVPH